MPKRNKKWRGASSSYGNRERPYNIPNRASRQYGGDQSMNQSYTETECDRVCATIPHMSNLASLSEQMAYAYRFLSLTERDHETRKAFMGSLEEKFRQALRGIAKYCFLYAFGSSVNHLGMKNCDLDLVLVTNGEINSRWSGPIPDTGQLLNVIKNLLYREQNHIGIRDIIPIRGARVPLIKFRHINTDIDCDVSFNRRMGVLNSRLIARLMQFSESAKLLAFSVRLWGKQKNFVGGGGIKINSYSMTLMVIFFLQHIRVLPALKFLQHPGNTLKDSTEGESFYITMEDFEPFRSQTVQYSLSELLTGFLGYYIRFSFETTIISVYHGEPLPVTDHPLFNAQLMNVQDPFERSFNTAKGVKSPMKAWFRKCLSLTWAHRVVLCSPSTHGQLWGLQYLFQPVNFNPNQKKPKGKQGFPTGASSSYASNMANYQNRDGQTLNMDVPYRKCGDPTGHYVRYCVHVVRMLKQIYDMAVDAPQLDHPLSEAIRQSLSRKRPSNEAFKYEDRFQAKQVKPDLNGSSTSMAATTTQSDSVRPHPEIPLVDLTQTGPTTSSAEDKVPIEYYIPYTIQVKNRVPNLRNTSCLEPDSFNYNNYVSAISGSLRKNRMVHGSDFTISFQPYDARFGTVDMEVLDIDTGCIESICHHLSTVLRVAIQDDGAPVIHLLS